MIRRTFRYDELPSTNDAAFDALGRGDGQHGDLFIARSQSKGRGTRGRAWSSQPGGLYLSLILRTAAAPAPGLWTIAGALAVREAALRFGAQLDLAWPNDIVSRSGAKVGGVLAESRDAASAAPGATYVLGIGVNVLRPAAPADLDRVQATSSLADESLTDSIVTIDEAESAVVEALCQGLESAATDPSLTYSGFLAACLEARGVVEVDAGRQSVTGRVVGISAAGELKIAVEGGLGPRDAYLSIAHVRGMKLL